MQDKKTSLSSNAEIMQRNAESAARMLKMLANPNRLMILCSLVKGEKSVGQLTDIIGISQSALSQHLAKMRALGLVETRKHKQTVYYKLGSFEVEAILSTLYLIYCRE